MGATLYSKSGGLIERMRLAREVRRIARSHGLRRFSIWRELEGDGIILSYEGVPDGTLRVDVNPGYATKSFKHEVFVSLVSQIDECLSRSNHSVPQAKSE